MSRIMPHNCSDTGLSEGPLATVGSALAGAALAYKLFGPPSKASVSVYSAVSLAKGMVMARSREGVIESIVGLLRVCKKMLERYGMASSAYSIGHAVDVIGKEM